MQPYHLVQLISRHWLKSRNKIKIGVFTSLARVKFDWIDCLIQPQPCAANWDTIGWNALQLWHSAVLPYWTTALQCSSMSHNSPPLQEHSFLAAGSLILNNALKCHNYLAIVGFPHVCVRGQLLNEEEKTTKIGSFMFKFQEKEPIKLTATITVWLQLYFSLIQVNRTSIIWSTTV